MISLLSFSPFCLFVSLLFFWDMVSLHFSGSPETHYVVLALNSHRSTCHCLLSTGIKWTFTPAVFCSYKRKKTYFLWIPSPQLTYFGQMYLFDEDRPQFSVICSASVGVPNTVCTGSSVCYKWNSAHLTIWSYISMVQLKDMVSHSNTLYLLGMGSKAFQASIAGRSSQLPQSLRQTWST